MNGKLFDYFSLHLELTLLALFFFKSCCQYNSQRNGMYVPTFYNFSAFTTFGEKGK